MDNAQQHTIDCCNSWCEAKGLPTYSELVEALQSSEREYENMEDMAPVDSGCFECTLGTVPNNLNTGLCAHHLRVKALKKAGAA